MVAKPYVLLQAWRILVDAIWWQNMPMGWEGGKMCGLGEGGKSLRVAAPGFPARGAELGWAQRCSIGIMFLMVLTVLRSAQRPLDEQWRYNG